MEQISALIVFIDSLLLRWHRLNSEFSTKSLIIRLFTKFIFNRR